PSPISCSALTVRAEDSRAAIHGVRPDQARATPRARESFPSVHLQERGEGAALSARVAIVAEARSACPDRLLEERRDDIVQPLNLFAVQSAPLARGIYPGAPERLVRVDVPDPYDPALIHQQLLHRLRRPVEDAP